MERGKMEEKTKMIIWVAALIVVITVILALVLYPMTLGSRDYWATYDECPSIARISNNTVRYELTWAHGYPDPNVKFPDCAFTLLVNGEATLPIDLRLSDVHSDFGGGVDARSVKGVGIMNASVMTQGNLSYIITFYDPDNNSIVGPGDYVTVQCTEPLSSGSSYTLNVFVDIDGTWGIGAIYGTYTA
jgi:hypothetical protein